MHKPTQDRIFSGLAERFSERIYNNPKGKIRLAILYDDLYTHLTDTTPLNILDMGAGLGQMSIWMAQQGHAVTLCEPAEDMLASAQKNIAAAELTTSITLQSHTLQQLSTEHAQQYDFITFHAVLEWMAEPQYALNHLLNLLKPQGKLSIMFYNHHSAVMRSLMVADFKRIKGNYIAAVGNKGFTPISPLEPQQVITWLKQLDVQIVNWTGIRAFYDYMHPEARKKANLDDIIAMERRYSHLEPWRSMARYQHIICQRKD